MGEPQASSAAGQGTALVSCYAGIGAPAVHPMRGPRWSITRQSCNPAIQSFDPDTSWQRWNCLALARRAENEGQEAAAPSPGLRVNYSR